MAKSSVMFSKKVPPWKSRRLANKLGFEKTTELSYLGVPLKLSALVAGDFDKMLQLINSKLHGWGVRNLSLAGRLTLLNSVLLMVPVYLLSHCIVPNSVIQLVERAARTFLWQGNDHCGMHFVAWDTVCKPKEFGGLGLHGLTRWRSALLARHSFRFTGDDNYLLRDCLVARYGPHLNIVNFRRADSPAWRLLCMGYGELAKGLSWEVANGARISFYTDNWIHGRNLASWPTFLNCQADLPAVVSSLISCDGRWDTEALQWLCGTPLAEYIAQIPLRGVGCEDSAALSCRFSGHSVSSYIYRLGIHEEAWEFSWLWKLHLQPKIATFWWRVCHGAIPTFTWLHRRGLHHETNCPLGCNVPEDTTHVLIHCEFLIQMGRALGQWGFGLPSCGSLPQLFEWLKGCAQDRKCNRLGTLYCSLVYYHWMNRLAKTHNRPYSSPLVTASLLMGNISCGLGSPIRFWDTTASTGDLNPSCWCPPPYGWLKANFDGALFPNGLGGCAMVVRDSQGKLVVAIGSPIIHWDNGYAELRGFMLIKDILQHGSLEAAGLIIEGDNINVIRYVKNMHKEARRDTMGCETHEFSFLLRIHNIIFKHAYREHNKCADYAAHVAVDKNFVWADATMAPPRFQSLLQQESFCN